MKVYVVEGAYKYEGGDVLGVFSTFDLAKRWIDNNIDENTFDLVTILETNIDDSESKVYHKVIDR